MDEKLAPLRRVGIKLPIMQAGMPGVAGPELASAVSRAGGIGTLGLKDVSLWEEALVQTRALSEGNPYAANLLLPYTRKKHIDAVVRQQTPIVTLFWGKDEKLISRLKENNIYTFQQVGSQDEAKFALDAGIDALIAQGTEAGGHIRGQQCLEELLPEVVLLAGNTPVFAAGGIYSAGDCRAAINLGAVGVSTGTRFLLSHESDAHPHYKARLLQSEQTVVTRLFGLGWSVPHRVVRNKAVNRWSDERGNIPAWLHLFNRSLGFTRKLLPFKAEAAKGQRPYFPILSSAALEASMPAELIESTALYAGEKIGSISDILSVKEVVEELSYGLNNQPHSTAEEID